MEKKAITKRTTECYHLEERFWEAIGLKGPKEVSDEDLDGALVKCFNEHFSGYQSDRDEMCLAALMHREPRLGRLGDKIPKAWKALRAWRLLIPCRSHAAYPLAV